MDIEQLQTFERIAREGSFSKAARALNISQPTISARIQGLEAEVGGELFVRGGRTITLTERGESFLPYAQRALAILAEGIEAAQLTQEGKWGRVTVGCLPSLSGSFLARTIAHFYKSHPEVEIFVRTGHSNQVEEMLYDGIVKIGLITWPYFNPELTTLLHFREPLVFVVPPTHSLAGKRSVTADEIHTDARPLLIVGWGLSTREHLARIMPHTERTMHVSVHTARDLLLQGTGAAFLTRSLVADDLKAGRLVEVAVRDLSPGFHESVLVHLTRSRLSTATQDFIAALEIEAGQL